MKSTVVGAICLSLAASIWGGMYVVSKYVLEEIPPMTLVWLRYVIGLVVLMTLVKWSTRKQKVMITKRDWGLFVWIGFIGYFVSIACQFIGTKLSDAHTGALITSATPAFMVLFARFILHEALTIRKGLSLILATGGVVIVVGVDKNLGSEHVGSWILVLAAVTWALLSVYVKVAAKRHSSLTITTYAILFACLFTTPFMMMEMSRVGIGELDGLIIFGVLYLGIVSTAGAFFLWNKGLELMDAGVGSLFFFFQPIVGAFFGWLLLNEVLEASFFVGALFIVAGVVIATWVKKERKEVVFKA
ncbi:DMT family transporter [Metabacillus iocasae]|uniref:Drug/metabolite transporter (DMT)-like permease n=1 Tax=Priestia iocasae TaxID=2291674 RepID=A0ABS2QSG4_9BACI|nr:EamA family transporter [Metabacillus iocasae]MBM7702403.1 drug/metabolite transporter (DMT)-like permease [Metabacillus iocasae]